MCDDLPLVRDAVNAFFSEFPSSVDLKTAF
jgi:hypothetical protein